MKILNVLILLLIISTPSREQDFSGDQEEVNKKPIFIPGIYLTFNDFIHNYPIEPSQIQTDINSDSRNFYFYLVREKTVNVMQGDSVYSINPRNMWGYSDGRGVYLNRSLFPKNFPEIATDISSDPWAKIYILGTLSLISYSKTIDNNRLNSSTPYMTSNTKNKVAEFILDTRDGTIHKSTLAELEKLISSDQELAQEFKEFRKDKDIKLYIFLKKYNEKYPTNFH